MDGQHHRDCLHSLHQKSWKEDPLSDWQPAPKTELGHKSVGSFFFLRKLVLLSPVEPVVLGWQCWVKKIIFLLDFSRKDGPGIKGFKQKCLRNRQENWILFFSNRNMRGFSENAWLSALCNCNISSAPLIFSLSPQLKLHFLLTQPFITGTRHVLQMGLSEVKAKMKLGLCNVNLTLNRKLWNLVWCERMRILRKFSFLLN